MTAARYRKKPVVIEAIEWTGDNVDDVAAFTGDDNFYPVGPYERLAEEEGVSAQVWDKLHSTWVGVKTGQHIIRGVVGEYYPIDPSVLAQTYEPAGDSPDPSVGAIDVEHLTRQRAWSRETFGPGPRTLGVIDHIRKELVEIEADPSDLGEWVDVIILGIDGAWRAGWEPEQIIAAVKAKQARNEARTWPDWRTRSDAEAIEHDRSAS